MSDSLDKIVMQTSLCTYINMKKYKKMKCKILNIAGFP